MTPLEIATIIRKLSANDLAELNRLLRENPGWGMTGVREPRRPSPPLDATGVALDAEVGKTDTGWPVPKPTVAETTPPGDMRDWPGDYWESME
jgi:hypothetical protein